MGWVLRTYNEHDDELVRELDLSTLGPRNRPIDRTGSLYLGVGSTFMGQVGKLHTYLDWDDPEVEPDVVAQAAT